MAFGLAIIRIPTAYACFLLDFVVRQYLDVELQEGAGVIIALSREKVPKLQLQKRGEAVPSLTQPQPDAGFKSLLVHLHRDRVIYTTQLSKELVAEYFSQPNPTQPVRQQ